jgi:hypothetical protein
VASGTQNNQVLSSAFDRYSKLIFWAHQHENTSKFALGAAATILQSLTVSVANSSLSLQFGVDESYTLSVSAPNAVLKVCIQFKVSYLFSVYIL